MTNFFENTYTSTDIAGNLSHFTQNRREKGTFAVSDSTEHCHDSARIDFQINSGNQQEEKAANEIEKICAEFLQTQEK